MTEVTHGEASVAPRLGALHERAGLALSLFVLAVANGRLMWWMVQARNTGFDISDESYNIAAAVWPDVAPHGPTFTGYYLRPLWYLSGQSLGTYRMVGLAMMVAASAVLACGLEMLIRRGGNTTSKATGRLRFAMLFLLCNVIAGYQFSSWIVSPNYNSLTHVLAVAFAGLVIGSTALAEGADQRVEHMRAEQVPAPARRRSAVVTASMMFVGVFLIGAKPTVAPVVCALAAWVVWQQRRNRTILGAAFAGLVGSMVVHLALFEFDIVTALRSRWRATQLSSLRQDHPWSALMESDALGRYARDLLLYAAPAVVLLIAVAMFGRSRSIRTVISAAAVVVGCAVLVHGTAQGGSSVFAIGVGIDWLVFVVIVAAGFVLGTRPDQTIGSTRTVVVGIALLALAVMCAFGSANGFVRQLVFFPLAVAVPVLLTAAVAAATPVSRTAQAIGWLVLSAAVSIVTLTAVADARVDPYRTGGPIDSLASPTAIAPSSHLAVAADTATLVEWINARTRALDRPVECLVNLEGGSPGISLISGIKPAGTTWMLGGYPNSTGAAASALEQDGCWKRDAFVLVTSPDSPLAIPTPEPVLARCQAPPEQETFGMYSGRVTLEWRICG